MNERIKNFLDLYLKAIDENIEEVEKELKEAGIDYEKANQKILKMIEDKRKELEDLQNE